MYNKILVPLDGSKLAECVLEHVLEIYKKNDNVQVVLLRVCEPLNLLSDYPQNMPDSWENHVKNMNQFSSQQCGLYLEEFAGKLQEFGVKDIKMESRLGDAATEIADFAAKNDIDLIIMASHGRSGASRWAFGSVADKVFRSTCVPILLVRAPGCFAGI